jgi:hypothetical protein
MDLRSTLRDFVHGDGNPFILQTFTLRGMKLKVFISDLAVETLGLGNTAAEGIPVAYLEQCQQRQCAAESDGGRPVVVLQSQLSNRKRSKEMPSEVLSAYLPLLFIGG